MSGLGSKFNLRRGMNQLCALLRPLTPAFPAIRSGPFRRHPLRHPARSQA